LGGSQSSPRRFRGKHFLQVSGPNIRLPRRSNYRLGLAAILAVVICTTSILGKFTRPLVGNRRLVRLAMSQAENKKALHIDVISDNV